MYHLSLVLLLSSCFLYGNPSPQQCCPERNLLIVENSTCWDGSNLTILLACAKLDIVRVRSTQESPSIFRVDEEDDALIVTTDRNVEYMKVDPDKYCIANSSGDDAEIALVCSQSDRKIHLTTKGVVLVALKAMFAVVTMLFLLAVLVIYLFIPDLRDIEGNCVVNFTLPLCTAHLAIIFIPVANHFESHACEATSFVYFISYLSAYNWLSVLSFHLWRITIRPIFWRNIRWFLFYFCYGYGLPLIILSTALTLYYTQDTNLQNQNDLQCWIDGSILVWSYFYGSTMVVSLISIVLQFFVAKKLWMGDGKKNQSPSAIRLRKKSFIYLHLLLIMVLVKIVEIIMFVYVEKHSNLDYVWHISDCRNLLVGGVVFFVFVVQRKKALTALAKRGLFCMTFPARWTHLVEEENEAGQSRAATAAQNRSSL